MTDYELTPWVWPTLASAVLTGAFGVYLWRRREIRGALGLGLASFDVSLWCIASSAEIAAKDFSTKEGWFAFQDALAFPGAVFALWFALDYAGLGRLLTRPIVGVLAASFIFHAPFYFIDGGRLLWSRIWWDGSVRGDLGPVGALFNIYGFGLFLIVTAVFAVLFIRSPAHRVPVALILLGQIGIRIAYPLGVLNIAYLENIPLIVLAFDFATLMYGIALFRLRMFDVVPVAREAIIAQMPDAMVVLDSAGRIVDFNRAAEGLFEIRRQKSLGLPISSLDEGDDLRLLVTQSMHAEGEIDLRRNAERRRCQVTTTPLADWQGGAIGALVTLHDITALRRTEERLLQQERILAGAREREHMAMELHDNVAQVLGFVSMQADATRKLLADGEVSAADMQLTRLAGVAREAHADVRGYIDELRTSVATPHLFIATLKRYLDGFAKNYMIVTELKVDPPLNDGVFGPEEQVQLMRIVQEALTNARRHGNAEHVCVALESRDGRARLVIEDDGCGFDADAAGTGDGGRYGLLFMRERAEELAAELEIDSSPGRGTRVVVTVPVRSRGEKPGVSEAAGVPTAPTGASMA